MIGTCIGVCRVTLKWVLTKDRTNSYSKPIPSEANSRIVAKPDIDPARLVIPGKSNPPEGNFIGSVLAQPVKE
jgi:hypothetical protein